MRIHRLYIFAFFIVMCHAAMGQVVINEIMYNAPDSGLEYIELYNSGDATVDLSGWMLKDNRDSHVFTLPDNTKLSGNRYIVIADDGELFRTTYGVKPAASGFTFNLSNDGDAVRLFDANGSAIESVVYDDRHPWPEEADGNGSSLERKNSRLPSDLAFTWDYSNPKETPGAKNSTHIDRIPPLILDADHSPHIPQPNQSITVTARILDVDGEVDSVKLFYGWNSGTSYQSTNMTDDGQHGDGQAGDGVYGAEVDGAGTGSIFRFYIEAKDNQNLASLMPTEGKEQPYMTAVERALEGEKVPILRIVMRPEINQQFLNQYRTDEYFPATFYDGDQVYYQVHIRHRGRSRIQNGRFKIRFPQSQLYRGKIRRLNFNGTDTSTILREYLSFQLYQDAGLPNLESELVRFHINGKTTQGTPYRVAIENPGSQFIHRRHYFDNDDGNLYKITLDGTPDNKATWRYVGDDPDLYRTCYIKQTNEEEDDYSDIIEFCRVLSQSNPWEPEYLDKVNSVLQYDSFLLWMAVSACVAHWDSPFTDHAHNYVLYNNPGTGQFNIIAWDLNGTFSYTSNQNDLNYRKLYTHIRSTKFPAINKILNHPVMGAEYYQKIDGLLNTLFTQQAMDQRIDAAANALKLNANSVRFLKTYVTQRIKDLSEWINREKGMAFITKPVYQGSAGQTYLYRAVAKDYRSNQSVTNTLKKKPSWLSVDPKTGELVGVPTEQGDFDVVLEAKSKKNVLVEQAFTIQVVDVRPRLIMTFNQDGSTINDLSPFAHQGSFRGSARRTEGRLGQGLSLSSNSYVTIPHDESLNLTGSITIEAWIKPNSISTGNPVIMTKGDEDVFNYTLMLGYGPFSWDQMEPCFMPHRFDIENRVYYGRKEIEARLRNRQWVHIAGTYDSNDELVCVYANNRRIVESSSRPRMIDNTRALLIGLDNSRSFQGVIDDVKILPYAKQDFAAGLCISQVDISGLSAAQDRIALSLSAYRTDSIDTGKYCLYLAQSDQWIALPSQKLAPGKTVSWWLDDLGMDQPLSKDETIALYPISSMHQASERFVLDQMSYGGNGPDANDPGVQAAVWLPNRSVKITQDYPVTLQLNNFADNDDMDLDWNVIPQVIDGPKITAFTINNGVEQTKKTEVQLQLSATSSNSSWKMRISNTPVMGEWLEFSKNIQWTLLPDDGPKTVYLQILNDQGERSSIVQATINLDSSTLIKDWKQFE